MTYVPVTVKRKSANAGRPSEKFPYILLVKTSDVSTYTRDVKGVLITGFALAAGAKAIGIFQAVDKNGLSYKSSGDKGISSGQMHSVEVVHPGSYLEIDEFVENYTNEPVLAIQVYAGEKAKVGGTPFNAMFLETESTDNAKERITSLKFSQLQQGPVFGYITDDLMPTIDQAILDLGSLVVPGV
ncbi:MAG: hypothetical protein PHV20_12410 [Bacteroidales bacterium]|nr:hypothetical protein [Bacteroidales bacterium]